MRRLRKKVYSIVSLVLLVCVLVTLIPTSVFAAPGASESENVGTSMYDVSTALTAYANNVVGSNTNDKHEDHELKEVKSVSPGIAGAFIGYGDEDKGFYAYISSNTAKSVTTSSYDAWLNVGDNGSIYAYARYGRLLADLGLDETGDATGSSSVRGAFGLFMQGSHAVSSFIPKIFDTSLKILKTLNPFQFFAGTVELKDENGTVVSTETDVKDAITNGSLSEGTTVTDAGGDYVHLAGDNEFDAKQSIGTSAAFVKLINYVSDIYGAAKSMGIFVVLPMLVIILLWALLFKHNKSGVVPFLVKMTFMVIGVPLCGMLYTAVLDNMTTVTQQSPAASRLVACTFVDFQSWVQASRLDLPSGVNLESAGKISNDGDGITAAGSASATTVRKLRNITYKLNNSIYGFTMSESNFGLGIQNGTDTNPLTNPGMWNSTGTLRENKTNDKIEKQVNAMLQRYRSGDFYQASAWETAVNSSIDKDSLGQTPSTANASTNDGKAYQMYDDTDEVSDWMNRTIADNKKIFNDTEWQEFNIFGNGKLQVATSHGGAIDANETLIYNPSGNTFNDKTNPSENGGLSSISMYNYLSTSFDDASISVYSAQKSTSEYTKKAHYSVTLIGSGALRGAYAVNCVACLFAFALVGVIYGLGMVINNIKRGIGLIMQVPFAVMGMVRGVIQCVIYVAVMCVELIFSVFAYKWVCELLVLFASIIESPIEDAVKNASILIGGKFAFVADYISPEMLANNRMVFTIGMFIIVAAVIVAIYKVVRHNRSIMVAYEYMMCCYFRLLSFEEMVPILDAWMARRNSLYVWDSISEVTLVVSETVQDIATVDVTLQKGVQSV